MHPSQKEFGRGCGDPRPLEPKDFLPLAPDRDAHVFDFPADSVEVHFPPRGYIRGAIERKVPIESSARDWWSTGWPLVLPSDQQIKPVGYPLQTRELLLGPGEYRLQDFDAGLGVCQTRVVETVKEGVAELDVCRRIRAFPSSPTSFSAFL